MKHDQSETHERFEYIDALLFQILRFLNGKEQRLLILLLQMARDEVASLIETTAQPRQTAVNENGSKAQQSA